MEEQIFAGDTGFDKLTAIKVWHIQGKTLNVFDYKGKTLFLSAEVARCLYEERHAQLSAAAAVRDEFMMGYRVKLSDVSAAKKASPGKVTNGSWFITKEGVLKLADPKRETKHKPDAKALADIKDLFKTLGKATAKDSKAPAKEENPACAVSAKVIELPLSQEAALSKYKQAQSDLQALREAIIRLSVSDRGTTTLLEEYDLAKEWLAEKKTELENLGMRTAL